MKYDPVFIKKVVDDYLGHTPTVENSQRIVKLLSETHRVAVPKIRAILVSQGVYVAQPKTKTVVEAQDTTAIIAKFAAFKALDDGKYSLEMDRYRLVEELRTQLNYTGSAIEDCAKKNSVWPLSANERRLRAERTPARHEATTQSQPGSKKSFLKIAAAVVVLLLGVIIFSVVSDNGSPRIADSDDNATIQGTATAAERELYSDDLAPTATGMNSEQSSQYEQMSSEGKEYVDRQMEAYDALCARSSEC